MHLPHMTIPTPSASTPSAAFCANPLAFSLLTHDFNVSLFIISHLQPSAASDFRSRRADASALHSSCYSVGEVGLR